MQRLLDFIFNVHKLWSKRYAAVFFDYENMPTPGTMITVGDVEAEFKKIPPVKAEGEYWGPNGVKTHDPDMIIADKPDDTVHQGPFWVCRKCELKQISEPIDEGGTFILRCKQCGFRQVKQ